MDMTLAEWRELQRACIGPADMTIADWWRRHSAASKKRLMLKAGAVALGVVVGSIVVAKLTWGTTGPGLVTPLAFFGLFVAAVILFALAVVSSEELVDELESSHPPRVRKRGVVPRALRRVIAALGRAVLAWLLRIGLAIRRAMTPERLAHRLRALADALSGVPPVGVSATHAGPLARPAPRRAAVPPLHVPRRSLPTGRDALNRLERLYRRHLPRRRSGPERVRHDPVPSSTARRVRATGSRR
jgi:uncharacterized RDD family membrane protein YckC